ncbi:hypothetical protein J43TS9_28750 [Paenibacillus cineris]|nr:hypothetical protein J43TS9_28750 [Paenibacillus cineris]
MTRQYRASGVLRVKSIRKKVESYTSYSHFPAQATEQKPPVTFVFSAQNEVQEADKEQEAYAGYEA